MRFDRLALDLSLAYLLGKGRATNYPNGHMGFVNLENRNNTPDVQLIFASGPLTAYPWFPGIRKSFQNTFGCRAVVLHPKSSGYLELASNNPNHAPKIHQNFFSNPYDMNILVQGLRLVRKLLSGKEMDVHRGEELAPGDEKETDQALSSYIRNT